MAKGQVVAHVTAKHDGTCAGCQQMYGLGTPLLEVRTAARYHPNCAPAVKTGRRHKTVPPPKTGFGTMPKAAPGSQEAIVAALTAFHEAVQMKVLETGVVVSADIDKRFGRFTKLLERAAAPGTPAEAATVVKLASELGLEVVRLVF